MRKTIAAVIVLAGLAGCGDADRGPGDPITVVATTGVAADLVRAVGGERVVVTTLIPAGADPHSYEPRPRDIRALADAQLIVRSGGEIDEWLDGAIESAGSDAPEVTLLAVASTGGPAPPADSGTPAGDDSRVDPHWWHDPRAALTAVAALREALDAVAPGDAESFGEGADAATSVLRGLDRAIARCIDTIAQDDRKLVTSHDALGRYASRYGLKVVGAVIPARTTQARPASGTVAELVATIRRERVRAIFAEDSVNPKVERAIAKESGATIGGTLYADGLGAPGTPGETYFGMLASNTRTIVSALGGDLDSCELL